MIKRISESEIEQLSLDILKELGYKTLYGPDIAPAFTDVSTGKVDHSKYERQGYSDIVNFDCQSMG